MHDPQSIILTFLIHINLGNINGACVLASIFLTVASHDPFRAHACAHTHTRNLELLNKQLGHTQKTEVGVNVNVCVIVTESWKQD